MSMRIDALVGMGSAAAAGLVAQLPAPDTLDALGKWPVTLALIGLAAWCVWLNYRTAERGRLSYDQQVDALRKLTEEIGKLNALLAQRPCIRDPKND